MDTRMGDDNKVMRKIDSKDVSVFRLFDYKYVIIYSLT